MKVRSIQHETFEAPGAYLDWAIDRNHDVSISKVYENDPLPLNADDIDLLIIMGGPQSPDTTREECPHFDSNAEMDLIRKCVRADRAVIGVCLGAQLISTALGAMFEKSPEKEIGAYPIRLTPEGLLDEKLSHFGKSLVVGHWHNDMPGVTPGGKVLAESEGCPRQIVSYGERVYGFQCHMEFTREVVDLLIAEEEEFLLHNTTHRFVSKPDEIRNFDYTEMNSRLFGFLDKLIISTL